MTQACPEETDSFSPVIKACSLASMGYAWCNSEKKNVRLLDSLVVNIP